MKIKTIGKQNRNNWSKREKVQQELLQAQVPNASPWNNDTPILQEKKKDRCIQYTVSTKIWLHTIVSFLDDKFASIAPNLPETLN